MQVNDLSSVDPNVDYRQILPIQQKRTVAFINHFVMNTVSCLNNFAQSCESRLMEFEYKLEKVEASLLILESQLSSISGLEVEEPKQINNIEIAKEEQIPPKEPVVSTPLGPVANNDSRFEKFFKMLQFGVPPTAVKLKMQLEGVNPDILDTPNIVIPPVK